MERVTNGQGMKEGSVGRKEDDLVGRMQRIIGAALKEWKDEIGYRKNNKDEIEKKKGGCRGNESTELNGHKLKSVSLNTG